VRERGRKKPPHGGGKRRRSLLFRRRLMKKALVPTSSSEGGWGGQGKVGTRGRYAVDCRGRNLLYRGSFRRKMPRT